MAFPTTLAIDQTKEYDILAPIGCSRIVVQENFDSTHPPTDDLLMRGPTGSSQVRIPKGTPAIFNRAERWNAGQKVGTMQAATGSVTLQIIAGDKV